MRAGEFLVKLRVGELGKPLVRQRVVADLVPHRNQVSQIVRTHVIHKAIRSVIPGIVLPQVSRNDEEDRAGAEFLQHRHGVFDVVHHGIIKGDDDRLVRQCAPFIPVADHIAHLNDGVVRGEVFNVLVKLLLRDGQVVFRFRIHRMIHKHRNDDHF